MFWRNVATGGQTGPGGPSPPPPPHPKLSLADAWSIPGSWPGPARCALAGQSSGTPGWLHTILWRILHCYLAGHPMVVNHIVERQGIICQVP